MRHNISDKFNKRVTLKSQPDGGKFLKIKGYGHESQ